ncbi:Protein of unknown function [Gryllus bimaculatus]|nr:Protein of unknown function [Gryllus bimaculatus]
MDFWQSLLDLLSGDDSNIHDDMHINERESAADAFSRNPTPEGAFSPALDALCGTRCEDGCCWLAMERTRTDTSAASASLQAASNYVVIEFFWILMKYKLELCFGGLGT